MDGEEQPTLMESGHTEKYSLPGSFTLKYSKITFPEPFERIEIAGPLGRSFADKRMFLYLVLRRYPGGIAQATLVDMDPPQDVTDSLYSKIFPQNIQEILLESRVIEKVQPKAIQTL